MTTQGAIVRAAAMLGVLALAGVASGEPKFTAGPTARLDGGKVQIAFTVSEATDVEVAITDASGKVVRHLAAGLLGPNAPGPLVRDRLDQSLIWDGRDDNGKELAGWSRGETVFRVRVRAGIGARFGRVVYWEPPSLASRGVVGFDVDEQGHIYAINASLWEGRGGGNQLVVWDRQGRYQRQVLPLRADLDPKRVPGLEFTVLPTGQRVPNTVYWPHVEGERNMMIAREGRVTMFGSPGADKKHRLVRVMASDGSAPPEGWQGPALPGQLGKRFPGYMAMSPDGRTVYLTGMGDEAGTVMNVVCRAKWGDKEAETFVGKDAGLSDPRGLAADSAGRLYVCDFNHDRICVFGPDGKKLKDLPVTGPEQVEVHPGTGAVYVYSLLDGIKRETRKSLMYEKKALVKFPGMDDWKPMASLKLPERARHMHDAGPIMALDASADPPAVLISYVGRQEEGDHLWKVIDRGDRLERAEAPVPRHHWPFVRAFCAVAVDRQRDEVYLAGRSFERLYRMNGLTGELTDVPSVTAEINRDSGLSTEHPQVTGLAVDGQGRIYVRLMGPWSSRDNCIRRYDRQGKRIPFTRVEPASGEPDSRLQLAPHKIGDEMGYEFIVTQPSRGYHSGGLAVAANGDIYVVEKAVAPGKPGEFLPGNANSLNIYGPEGEVKKRGVIPWISAGVWGPRLDAAGNIYLTDAIRPNDPKVTSQFTGSLVKFAPTGGAVKTGAADGRYITRRNENDLPPTALEGAAWVYYGVGLTPFGHCVCNAAQFDLDGYGRSVVPDVNRHRAMMVDSAGNLLMTFGEYGSRDSAGPGSPVPVPEIPLWEPNAIGVSDRAVYIYDRRNHRILCVDFRYGAEAEAKIEGR